MTNLNSLQMFSNDLFSVRILMRSGEPWFVAADVCKGLEILNPSDAYANIESEDKTVLSRSEINTLDSSEGIDSRVQTLILVSEPGLYDLVMQSRKQVAKTFKKWVTHEVIPSIRKNGYYAIQKKEENTLPAVSEEDHFFLSILHADSKEETVLALKEYKNYRDELQKEVEQERDDAVRKRKAINDKRTATLMVAKREDNKKIAQLTCENEELKEQNEILKVSIGESNQWMSSAQLIQNFKLHRINGKEVKPRTLTTMLKKSGCRHRESEFPDAKGFKYAIFFVEGVKKALNIF